MARSQSRLIEPYRLLTSFYVTAGTDHQVLGFYAVPPNHLTSFWPLSWWVCGDCSIRICFHNNVHIRPLFQFDFVSLLVLQTVLNSYLSVQMIGTFDNNLGLFRLFGHQRFDNFLNFPRSFGFAVFHGVIEGLRSLSLKDTQQRDFRHVYIVLL